MIEEKKQEIVQKEQEIVQNRQLLRSMVSLLQAQGLSINDIAKQLNIMESEVDKILSGK